MRNFSRFLCTMCVVRSSWVHKFKLYGQYAAFLRDLIGCGGIYRVPPLFVTQQLSQWMTTRTNPINDTFKQIRAEQSQTFLEELQTTLAYLYNSLSR